MRLLIFLLFIHISFNSFSQEVKERPNNVIKVFGETTKDTIKNTSKDTTKSKPLPREFKNAIKVNPLLLGRGLLACYYEHVMNIRSSFEIMIAFTFQDYIYELQQKSDYYYDEDEVIMVNLGGELSYRYFTNYVRDLEGFYISPVIGFKKYATETTRISKSLKIKEPVIKKYSFLDLNLRAGYQFNLVADIIKMEAYLGLGMRNVIRNRFIVTDPIKGNFIEKSETDILPQGLLGCKFAFAF